MNGVKESLRERREPLWCGMACIARASYATQDRLCGGLGEMGAREMWCEVHLSRRSTLASWLAGGDARFRMADCSYARTTGYLYVGSIFFSPFVGCSDGKLSILWPADSYGRPCGGAGGLCASTGE